MRVVLLCSGGTDNPVGSRSTEVFAAIHHRIYSLIPATAAINTTRPVQHALPNLVSCAWSLGMVVLGRSDPD